MQTLTWTLHSTYLHRSHGKSAHLPAMKCRTWLAHKNTSSKVSRCKTKEGGTVMCTLLNPSCMNVSPPGNSSLRMLSPRLMASLWIEKKTNTNKQKKKIPGEHFIRRFFFLSLRYSCTTARLCSLSINCTECIHISWNTGWTKIFFKVHNLSPKHPWEHKTRHRVQH